MWRKAVGDFCHGWRERKSMIKAYLAMCYRGPEGDAATQETINENIRKAKEVGHALCMKFGEYMELFIPHINQEMVHRLWQKGYVDSDNILEVCCDIVRDDIELLIVCGPVSGGMLDEIQAAQDMNKEIIYIDQIDETAYMKVAMALMEILKGRG